jgi:hypothetical protein
MVARVVSRSYISHASVKTHSREKSAVVPDSFIYSLVCIGGIDVYPSVYVMTKDEVSRLADYFNSIIWTEESMDDYIPPTGSMGMTYYIYKDGKYSSFGDLTSVYYSDGVRRRFRKTPKDGDYSNSLSARDFLTPDTSRHVGTHLNEQHVELTDQEFWDLIWNDALPWIEENGY